MRYREGQDINNLEPETLSNGISDITVAYTLLLGFAFVAMGRFGKQTWLVFWGVMTVLAVMTYIIIRCFDLL